MAGQIGGPGIGVHLVHLVLFMQPARATTGKQLPCSTLWVSHWAWIEPGEWLKTKPSTSPRGATPTHAGRWGSAWRTPPDLQTTEATGFSPKPDRLQAGDRIGGLRPIVTNRKKASWRIWFRGKKRKRGTRRSGKRSCGEGTGSNRRYSAWLLRVSHVRVRSCLLHAHQCLLCCMRSVSYVYARAKGYT